MKQNNFLAESWLPEEAKEELGVIQDNMDEGDSQSPNSCQRENTAGEQSPPGRKEGQIKEKRL